MMGMRGVAIQQPAGGTRQVAIRNDFARPTVHARNLFHGSEDDVWATWDANDLSSWPANCPVLEKRQWLKVTRQQAGAGGGEAKIMRGRAGIARGMHRLLKTTFRHLRDISLQTFDRLLAEMTTTPADPLALDAFVRANRQMTAPQDRPGPGCMTARILEYGLTDGSNEARDVSCEELPLRTREPGIRSHFSIQSERTDPDRWQQLSLDIAIDQSGNLVAGVQPFLTAEWGNVRPFALAEDARFHCRERRLACVSRSRAPRCVCWTPSH